MIRKMILYLSEPGSVLRKKGGRYIVELNDKRIGEIPAEKLEAVVLFSGTHITSPCMVSLFEMGIPVTWLSSRGKFFGRAELTGHVNIERQREQFRRSEDEEFCLGLAKKFINAKIRNSLVLLRRYNRNLEMDAVDSIINEIQKNLSGIDTATSMSVLSGVEGYTSRLYFQALSEMIRGEFKFKGRTRQPPKDPFNSLLSFGYTLLMYEIYTAIVNRRLHPYMGFLHRMRRGHPALASDLMEEWRAVLVDTLVLSQVQRGSINWEDFDVDAEEGGVYLRKGASREFIKKFEERLRTENKYVAEQNPISFRDAIDHQVLMLVKSIEESDPGLYKPVIVR
jgi:CRISPR-associated protein Cas1